MTFWLFKEKGIWQLENAIYEKVQLKVQCFLENQGFKYLPDFWPSVQCAILIMAWLKKWRELISIYTVFVVASFYNPTLKWSHLIITTIKYLPGTTFNTNPQTTDGIRCLVLEVVMGEHN